MTDSAAVARAHDAMAPEYDTIEDLWYAHLFNQIHRFVLDVLPTTAGRRALDVGCGTGFQSFLLARAGARVRGFDIAAELIDRARAKQAEFEADPAGAWPFYRTSLARFDDEQRRIVARADQRRGTHPALPPDFAVADALDSRAYGDGGYDIVTCCGSVLSFLGDPDTALDQMAASLAPGGTLILEVEQRYNLDLLWPAWDRIVGGRLDYDQSWREILHNLFARHPAEIRVDYPFELASGGEVTLPIRLFTTRWLDEACARRGLSVISRRGCHILTNLIPSTVLHRSLPSRRLQSLFGWLRSLDQGIDARWPFRGLGCSVLYAVRRATGE